MLELPVEELVRDLTVIRGRKVRNTTLVRDWRCGTCESKLREIYDSEVGWRVVCAKNRGHDRNTFITAASLEYRIHDEMVQAETLNRLEREAGMPLKDRDRGGLPKRVRLTRIGRIRQGTMRENQQGKKYPVALPYFIIDPTTDSDDERAEVLAAVLKAIEEHAPAQDLNEPTVLPIRFMAQEEEIISPEAYKKRRGHHGTAWCVGDGENIQWKLDNDFRVEVSGGETKDGKQIECPGGERDESKRHEWCDECKPEVELNFSIWGYERTGTWMLRTTSMSFRDQFRTAMGMVYPMIDAGLISGIASVPFLLRRKEEDVLSPREGGKLASTTMPITSIEIEPNWFQEQMRKAQNRALAAPEQTVLLESGDEVEAEVVVLPGELPDVPYEKIDDWNNDADFWTELIRQASARLGYDGEEGVKGALRELFGTAEGAEGYKPEDIWQMLREHQMTPEEAPF